MQYPAVDFDYLARETERQKRLQQEARKALELKKARLRDADLAAREPAAATDTIAPETARPVSMAQKPIASVTESIDKVRSIPEMRSALIPLDPDMEGDSWSKPFSLPKADLEPWQAYLRGYCASRLFTEASRQDGPRDVNALDFGVQALLELKRVDPRLIVEPVVQIDQPVEYLDLAGELRKCTDPIQARTLAGIANDVHEAQLQKAVEAGRALGDHLCDALLGEGHANLIKAWMRVYHRKPNVTELHLMLTTGRVKVVHEAQKPALDSRPRQRAAVADAGGAGAEDMAMQAMDPAAGPSAAREAQALRSPQSTQASQSTQPEQRPAMAEQRRPLVAVVGDDEPEPALTVAPVAEPGLMKSLARKIKLTPRQKLLLHALHVVVSCAALAAYVHFI
jgi:hypothetical protein